MGRRAERRTTTERDRRRDRGERGIAVHHRRSDRVRPPGSRERQAGCAGRPICTCTRDVPRRRRELPQPHHAEARQPAEHAGRGDGGRLHQRRRTVHHGVQQHEHGRPVERVEDHRADVLQDRAPAVAVPGLEREAPVGLGGDERAEHDRDHVRGHRGQPLPRDQEQQDVEPRAHAADERVAAELDGHGVQPGTPRRRKPDRRDRQRDRRAHHVHHALSAAD
jgi:hypothetical protein